MDIKLEKEEVISTILEVGDIVETDIDVYILMKVHNIEGKYELRSFNGKTGYCGVQTLEEVRLLVKRSYLKIYKSTEYELKLVRKE